MPFRIGLFPDLQEPWLGWMLEAMHSAGFRQAHDYVFVESGASYSEPTVAAAQRPVGRGVELILVASTAHANAARRSTTRLPIVMWGSGFPVEAGVAASLSKPASAESAWRGATFHRRSPREEIEPFYREIRRFAKALGVGLHTEEIASPGAVHAGLASLEAARPEALLVTAGPGFFSERHRVMRFALEIRVDGGMVV